MVGRKIKLIKVHKQRNFPRGRIAYNIRTNKRIKVLAIGKLSAIGIRNGKHYLLSSKNLRLEQ